jgi:hypothetical protein
MFRAAWNGAVLAESDRTVKLEGNHYFPPESTRPASWLARAGGLRRRRRPGQQDAVDEPRRPASG